MRLFPRVLSIFKTDNLRIRSGLLPPLIPQELTAHQQTTQQRQFTMPGGIRAQKMLRMPLVLFLCPDNTTYKSVTHQKRG